MQRLEVHQFTADICRHSFRRSFLLLKELIELRVQILRLAILIERFPVNSITEHIDRLEMGQNLLVGILLKTPQALCSLEKHIALLRSFCCKELIKEMFVPSKAL